MKLQLTFSIFFTVCGLSFAQTVYLMNFNDYPVGSHEAQPSLNMRWSKELGSMTNSFSVSSVSGSLQGKAFTGLGSLQHFRTYRWNYQNYSSGIPTGPVKGSADAEVKARFRFEGGSYNVFGIVFHNTSTTEISNYISCDAVSYGSTKQLRLTIVQNNTPTYRSASSISISNNTWHYLRAWREGNLFRLKFWPSGESEPSDWTVSWTENTFQGVTAIPELGVYSDNTATVDFWQYTDLTVRSELKITSNLSGKKFTSGNIADISWNQSGLDSVGIYLSTDNGISYKWLTQSLDTSNGIKTIQWIIPNGIVSGECFFKVKSLNLSDSSGPFTFSPVAFLKIIGTDYELSKRQLPDSLAIKFISIALDSVNIHYSKDSLNWIPVKRHLKINRIGLTDTSSFMWHPEKSGIYGKLFIRISEDADTSQYFIVRTSNEISSIGLSAELPNGYQNSVWYSNPITVNGRLIEFCVKTYHWGFYGQSQISMFSYDTKLRQWKFLVKHEWDSDPYMDNIFYADSENTNLFYFGGEFLTNPGNYYYIQIALNNNDFSFQKYQRAINFAPLEATDTSSYPISNGLKASYVKYLGRVYILSGNKILVSDSVSYTGGAMPQDTLVFANLKGSEAEKLNNLGLYAFDKRIMLTDYYHDGAVMPVNYALKALPEKHNGPLAYDISLIGNNLISVRNMFRGIYPKAKR